MHERSKTRREAYNRSDTPMLDAHSTMRAKHTYQKNLPGGLLLVGVDDGVGHGVDCVVWVRIGRVVLLVDCVGNGQSREMRCSQSSPWG